MKELGANIIGLFPTPVGQYKLPPLTDRQYNFVLGQDNIKNRFNKISLTRSILEDKLMTSVKSRIQSCLDNFLMQTVSPRPNIKLRITQSWSNYTGIGEEHHRHSHANSVVSGVYYVQTLDTDTITFHNHEREEARWDVEPRELHHFNAPTWWISTPQDSLVLFPSELAHSVSSRETKDADAPDRVSISFNTFYTGELGGEQSSTKLVLT